MECHLYWTADSDRVPLGAKAEWAPHFGEHLARYEHRLVPASGALTASETGKLGDWKLNAAVPWTPPLSPWKLLAIFGVVVLVFVLLVLLAGR